MNRIDVHHHFIPPAYIEAYKSTPGDPSGWHLPEWTPEASLALMASHSTHTAILSLTAPGTSILAHSPTASATLARETNIYAAGLHAKYPARFGFFASLPHLAPDSIPAAIEEVVYAMDTLHADGVTLYTRYSGMGYLGNKAFGPLWMELNRRKAVVFVHPTNTATATSTSSDGQHKSNPHLVNSSLPQPIIDYPHETCRAALDLITSGTVARNPNVKIILSHGGGTLPILATRAAHLLHDARLSETPPEIFLEQARRFYFDLALSGNEANLALLLGRDGLARSGHVLYGSDFPYAPVGCIDKYVVMMEKFLGEEDGDRMEKERERDIARGAAVKLFPRFQMEGETGNAKL